MKLCVFLILATATSVIADGHADICSTQFNYWYSVSNNLGPAGYPVESAEEKLHGLVKNALPTGAPIPSMCKMQENANSYYDYWEKILRQDINKLPADAYAPGFGFPFQSEAIGATTYTGLAATCVPEDSKFSATAAANAGGPAASCAFGYPGSKTDVTIASGATIPTKDFDNVKSTCRLKILGFEDEDLELQWCITDILGTMRVDKAGGYYDGNYDGFESTTPDLKCSLQNSFNDANPISGTNVLFLFEGAPYPIKNITERPNPGGDPVTWNCFDTFEQNIITVEDCFNESKNDTVLKDCFGKFVNYTENPKEKKQYVKNSPNDPYQAFPLLFRQLADQKVAGMCNACEECTNAIRHDGVYPDPEEYCQRAGKCGGTPSPPLPPMPPPPKKSSKKK